MAARTMAISSAEMATGFPERISTRPRNQGDESKS